jgi:class 3 adenylate cyclase
MPEERKLVTILFADVIESTALGEVLDAEDVRALMGRYYEQARRVMAEHGGLLEKFIGDAVMAIFGLPRALGNDAECALAAALALRKAVAADPLLEQRLLLRMGINTGEVVATSDPLRGDFLVTGDAVNVAARLQQTAGPAEILVSERTALATQAAFLFEDVRLIEVKGKRLPLRALPLAEARAMRQVGRPPLVGRGPDVFQLDLLRARTLEEYRPHLVSIVAPAGTGKTRLLEEFLARLDPAEGFRVAIARCLPYGQTLVYWPLRSLLTDLLDSEISKTRVMAAFMQGGQTPEDAVRLAELVLATVGLGYEGVIARESLLAAWRLLLEALAQQAPRIIVFEDLHWASESLLDLVEYLTHPRVQAALLLIVLSRPELLDRRPTWGGGRRSFTALALEPLSEGQTQELVKHLAAELPQTSRDQIVQRAGGNPFFTIELVRGLLEQGREGYAAGAASLPDTVHAAVLAQLDLLSPQERAVVQVAAVAGRAFRPALLQAVLPALGPGEVETALDGLLSRDLIVSTGGGAFTFRHVLIRDVAYATLARAERVRLHIGIASWLEASVADRLDEFTDLLAYHYREAVLLARQAAVPLAVPVDTGRAVHYLERAGRLASQSCAFAEAGSYVHSAIDLVPQEEHVRLYEQLGDCVNVGETALLAYRQALSDWRGATERDPLVGARLLRKLLMVALRHNMTARATQQELAAWLAEAQRLAEEAGNEDEHWRVQIASTWMRIWLGNCSAEEAQQERAVALAAAAYFEGRADWASFHAALDGYNAFSLRLGAFEEGLEASRRRLSVPYPHALERGDALSMVGANYYLLGNYAGSIAFMRQVLAELRPGESVVPLVTGVAGTIGALWLSGRWSEVSDFLPRLADIWESIQFDRGWMAAVPVAAGYLAVLEMAVVREDRAAAEAAASVIERCLPEEDVTTRALLTSLREDHPGHLAADSPFVGGWNEILLIPLLLFLSEHGLTASQALIAHLQSSSLAHAHLLIKCLEITEALAAEDLARLSRAIDEAEADGLIVHAARMRIVLAQRAGDRAQLERARPVLERLGDRRFLRRLEEVAAALHEKEKLP